MRSTARSRRRSGDGMGDVRLALRLGKGSVMNSSMAWRGPFVLLLLRRHQGWYGIPGALPLRQKIPPLK